ncbi:MAG: protein translocase subunit SecD, partial [Actinomycetota bacterium]|nr:protein translocase subunit SecD [Actinomycetota bacterium]
VRAFDDATWNNGLLTEEMLARPEEDRQLVEYVAINWDERHFRGEDLNPSSVNGTFDSNGRRAVSYETKGSLAQAYGDWSEKYLNDHSAIILNGVIRSAPYFVSRIPGRGQISGSFTEAEVEELVKVLRTGSLKVKPQLLSDLTVGETLGAQSIRLGAISLIAGGIAVFLFMLWYYRLAGIVACVSLSLNMFLLWSALLFMQATITLPGLGGIVLTIGMAVDANVLIYERIREEFDKGKDMIRAVRAGFERAMSAILDSNITTFLTGMVLFNVGVGPVRGFAVTLMVGIVMTVFTQFFVTRLVFHLLIESDKLKNFHVRRLFAQPKLDYLKAAKITVPISSVVILGLLAIAYTIPSEVSMGIDFKGGANMRMLVKEETTPQTIRETLRGNQTFAEEFGSFTVNVVHTDDNYDTSRQFNIRVKLTDKMRDEIEVERAAWRKTRDEAESNEEPPPAPYEAPYLVQMREIFGDILVDEASSDERVIEGPRGNGFAMIDLHLQDPVNIAEAQAKLDANKLPDAKITVLGDDQAQQGKDLLVQFTTSKNTPASGLLVMAREALAGLKTVDGEEILLSNPFPEAEEIQGRMVGELRNAAIGALIMSWMLIIFYLRVRFHEYKYGIAAVCALVHDVLIAFGVVVAINSLELVYAEINLTMIACFLTIIGYSVNDTIVIFDRIRENVRHQANMGATLTYRQLINLSVNQTMSRTILTTALTLFVVMA